MQTPYLGISSASIPAECASEAKGINSSQPLTIVVHNQTYLTQETPARKELRQNGTKSLQQTRYHTPTTQPRMHRNTSMEVALAQRLSFAAEENKEDAGLHGVLHAHPVKYLPPRYCLSLLLSGKVLHCR